MVAKYTRGRGSPVAVLAVWDYRLQQGRAGPAGLGLGSARPGTRRAKDVAERMEDTGPRLLCAPLRIYLGDGPGVAGVSRAERETPQI